VSFGIAGFLPSGLARFGGLAGNADHLPRAPPPATIRSLSRWANSFMIAIEAKWGLFKSVHRQLSWAGPWRQSSLGPSDPVLF
jgi:hypothetical protein